MAAFQFDLFISYSKHDEPWAKKLAADLIARGIRSDRIFLDKDYLKPGARWESIMSNAVVQAQVLVCFWSKNAKESQWVPEERLKFKMTMDYEEKWDRHTERTLIMIPLEEVARPGETDPYSQFQAITDIRDAGLYPNGINSNPDLWSQVVSKVEAEIVKETKLTVINLLILAMTRDRIDALNLKSLVKYRDGRPPTTLANAIKNMGISTDVSLLDRLDPTMLVPGGGTLEDLLKSLKISTATTPTEPTKPKEIQILLPSGDSLSAALKKQQIMTVDDLLSWLKQNPDVTLPDGSKLDAILQARGIKDNLEELMIKTALRQYYGASPLNWRPFGSPTEIRTIMDDVQGSYNRMLQRINSPELPLHWNIEEFTTATVDLFVLSRAVIVVDPLSLYDSDVSSNLNYLYKSYENPRALIMAFAPFILPTPTSFMRVLIRDKAPPIYDHFFQPEFKPGRDYAKCGPDVGDQADIERWLWNALQPQFGPSRETSRQDGLTLTGTG